MAQGERSGISYECHTGIISSDEELKYRLLVCEKAHRSGFLLNRNYQQLQQIEIYATLMPKNRFTQDLTVPATMRRLALTPVFYKKE
jgi:hypothetical protein